MITELPKDARQCSLSGVYITPDAKVFKAGKNGFREVTVKADKRGPGKFYNSVEKKYYSLTQAYAEAFVPNGEQKPLAFIKDASHGLDPANIMWATNDEWREYWKEHAERKCKCCGKLVEKDMAGELCKGCFTKMSNAKPDTDEIKRFQERVAATGFDPNKDFFSGRQRDALELFCSGVSMPKIASILGCDLKTANACIKSAKVARTLERATSDNVTPIGYKSAADVLPASITLSADGSKPIASKDLKVTRDAKITNQSSKSEPLSNVYVHLEKPKVAEPEETTPDWYDQERLLARENIPVQKSYDTDSHTIIGKLAKLLKCSLKTAIACFKLARKLESEGQLQDNEPEATHNLISAKSCNLAVSKTNAITSSEDEASTSETVKSVEPVVVYVKVPFVKEVVKEVPVVKEVVKEVIKEVPVAHTTKESEISKLFDYYKAFNNKAIPFSYFCKVYWVAGSYNKHFALDLTNATIAHLFESGLEFNTQNIHDTLFALAKINCITQEV